jgi:hypothetical protein
MRTHFSVFPDRSAEAGRARNMTRRELLRTIGLGGRGTKTGFLSSSTGTNAEDAMNDGESLGELEISIAAIQENLRELIEQAAAYSGAADEERTADRIADQEAKLDALIKRRGALLDQSSKK